MNNESGEKSFLHEGDDDMSTSLHDKEDEALIRVNKHNTMTLADWFRSIQELITDMREQNKTVFYHI